MKVQVLTDSQESLYTECLIW